MELAVHTRDLKAKSAKALRKEGLIPAELYGHKVKNEHFAVPAKEFGKIFREAGTSTVVTLHAGSEKKSVVIHEVGRDYVTGEFTNIDFYQVKMNEKMRTRVPVEFTGVAAAVKEKGAVVNKSMLEIEVEALPNDLPHRLTVDLSVLDDVNKSVYVRDLAVPKGVTIHADPDSAIVTALPPVKEEEKVEAPVDVADVKVESEEKKAERAAEKTEDTK